MRDPDDDLVVEEVQPKTVTLVRTRGVGQGIEVKVLTGRLVRNGNLIMADGGRVIMTAQGAGEEMAGVALVIEALQDLPIAQRPEHILDIGGLAGIMSPIAIPCVDDRIVEGLAIGVQQVGTGSVETESILIVKPVFTRAQGHDDGVVEEMTLQHRADRL